MVWISIFLVCHCCCYNIVTGSCRRHWQQFWSGLFEIREAAQHTHTNKKWLVEEEYAHARVQPFTLTCLLFVLFLVVWIEIFRVSQSSVGESERWQNRELDFCSHFRQLKANVYCFVAVVVFCFAFAFVVINVFRFRVVISISFTKNSKSKTKQPKTLIYRLITLYRLSSWLLFVQINQN